MILTAIPFGAEADMSKLNHIQQALQAIDQAKFQKLGDLYLRKQPRYMDLRPIGSVIGADKVKKGVPDSIIRLPEGGHALVSYTTQQTNLFRKLGKDLDSSFDKSATHIPVDEVKEIILCHNSALEMKDERALIDKGRERNSEVTIIGLEKLSYALFDKYPGLAEEFLGIEVDTRQIVPMDEFVAQYNKSSFATRLDTKFHFREEELKKTLEALNTSNVVLVAGSAGIGKTRFMLEAATQFLQHDPSFEVWCIYRRGPDLFRDVRSYFTKPGKYLILIDDANRLSGLDYILQLLHDRSPDYHVKILATVRDYAHDKIYELTAKYVSPVEIQLQALKDEQIRTLIGEETSIKNYEYLKRISEIAQGNPRLAMMAAKVAIEHNTPESIGDATSIYDEYFSCIRADLQTELGDVAYNDAIRVAGIISFLRVVDKSNSEQMEQISRTFAVSPEVFWEVADQLHRLEVFDLYENEVVKVADQVLSTYLFYLAVFKEQALDFGQLLDHYFPHYKSHFIDALNPVFNALGARIENQLKVHIDRKWQELQESGNVQEVTDLIWVFWFVNPIQTLLHIRNGIQAFPTQPIDIEALDFSKAQENRNTTVPLLSLLGNFRGTDTFPIALDLLLEAFAKAPATMMGTTLQVLIQDYGFRYNSYAYNFYYQREVTERLWERAKEGRSILFSRLFIVVAGYYLRTHYDVTEPKSQLVISIINFDLAPSPGLTEFRRLVLRRVFQLFAVPELQADVLGLLHKYCHGGYEVSGTEIVQGDAQEILPFISASLDATRYEHAGLVQSYLGFLQRENVDYAPDLSQRFTNDFTVIADLLLFDRLVRTGRKWQDAQTWQNQQIKVYFEKATPEDYKRFFQQCLELGSYARERDEWQLRHGLEKVFQLLLESEPNQFVAVISLYLDMGNPFETMDRRLLKRLIEIEGVDGTYSLISSKEFRNKTLWLFNFYTLIPPDQVRDEHATQLYELYRTSRAGEIYFDLDGLERYLKLDNRFILRVMELLLARFEEEKDSAIAFKLSFLFDMDRLTAHKLVTYLGSENLDIVKRAYLAGTIARDHIDYEGRVLNLILDLDSSFLLQYIDAVLDRIMAKKKAWLSRHDHDREYEFLWRRDDYSQLIRSLVQHLFEVKQGRSIYINDYLVNFFDVKLRDTEKSDAQVVGRRIEVLSDLIKERATDSLFMEFVFSVVGELPKDERRTLIAAFLESNRSIENFRMLSLDPRSGGYVGSAVPVFKEQMDFLESLLPMTQGIELLEHKLYIQRRIEGLQRAIEAEKRREFLRD